MLYRFADEGSLAAWEASPQRAWWLEAAQGQVAESRVERRTGIEGWFDEPATVEARAAGPAAPPRWKQMVVIFMVFLPLSLTANAIASQTIAEWPLVPRVVLVTTLMTPLMTYVFLPWVTKRMAWWLHG
jgi:antibiotic biosynthesis monooxygenase (ABM) superfamily enzyme